MPLTLPIAPNAAPRPSGSAALARARLRQTLIRDREAVPTPSAAEVLARLLDEPLPSLIEHPLPADGGRR
ncbi:MAG: hypothetical protein ACUVS4_02470 [Chloroflexaceae bacterium]